MKAIIETADHGKIELEGGFGQPGMAYFHKDDIESPIDGEGNFTNLWGAPFRVHWSAPYGKYNDICLEIRVWQHVGRGVPISE